MPGYFGSKKKSVAAQKIISNMALAVQGQVQVVPDDGRGVYVGGLPKHAEWQELKDHMKYLGYNMEQPIK